MEVAFLFWLFRVSNITLYPKESGGLTTSSIPHGTSSLDNAYDDALNAWKSPRTSCIVVDEYNYVGLWYP